MARTALFGSYRDNRGSDKKMISLTAENGKKVDAFSQRSDDFVGMAVPALRAGTRARPIHRARAIP